jgi:hypothetical protein
VNKDMVRVLSRATAHQRRAGTLAVPPAAAGNVNIEAARYGTVRFK